MSKATPEQEQTRAAEVKRDWKDIMQQAIDEHKPVKKYVLFSGGNDSTGLLHRVWNAGLCDAAVHINTGIGVEQTREFVRKYCADNGIPLIEKHPPHKKYKDIILEHGFPGPGAHRYVYIWLKERAIQELVRESKTQYKDRIMLITGVRASESNRRMGHVEPIKRVGAQVWVAPLIDYTKTDLIDYRINNNVPENPVSAILHMSGECLCGAFAKPGEMQDLEIFFPETARYIHSLEDEARKAGVKQCTWGPRGKKKIDQSVPVGPLCSDCTRMPGEEDDYEIAA